MEKQKQTVGNYMNTLTEDAQAVMAATSDVAGEKVGKARKHLAAALERSKEVYSQARDKALDGAKATDQAVRGRPYQAIAIAFGVGALLGSLTARRRDNDRD
jgi:ElaB/YqjD/DUF883 family membrane-anchored ribosome-binding protein